MKKIVKHIIISIAGLGFLISLFIWKSGQQNLNQRQKISIGTIESISPSPKIGNYCNYYFDVLEKRYSGSVKLFSKEEVCDQLLGKKFPVIYDSLDVQNNHILILKEHFRKYEMVYPDSLVWFDSIVNDYNVPD